VSLPSHRTFLAVAVLCTVGCSARGPELSELPVQEFAGHLTATADAYWFRPCTAAEERWWVTLTDRSVGQVRAALDEGRINRSSPAFVRWRAALTDERVVGPGGPALLVREVLEIRSAGAADCGMP
jgi:hypothetical protein